MSENKRNILCSVLSILGFCTILLFWYVLSWLNPELMPTPFETLRNLIRMVLTPENGVSIFQHVWASFVRVIVAYIVATIAGIALGVAFGWSKKFYQYIGPIFELLRPIPPIAWIPLIIIWFGIGEVSKMAIVFIGAFVPVAVNTFSGILQIDPIYEKVGKILGANKKEMLFEIVIPASFPQILAGMKTALSQSWACVIAAEMIVAQKGLSEGLITSDYFTAVILLIIVSSITVPIILKLLYKGEQT